MPKITSIKCKILQQDNKYAICLWVINTKKQIARKCQFMGINHFYKFKC